MTDAVDNLAELFTAQKALQENSFGFDFVAMTDEERIEFIKWNAYALEDEIHEATAEVGWKPWASSRHINRSAYVGELVDSLHFLINLFLAVEADSDEVMERYKLKRDVNAKRQREGYDGVSTKDADGRAMDEPVVVDGGIRVDEAFGVNAREREAYYRSLAEHPKPFA